MSEYVRVVPSTETYEPESVPELLRGFHHLNTPHDDEGLLDRVLSGDDSPTFEFIVLSSGSSAPVEFYYGVDDPHLGTLTTQLRNLYPDSFDISRTGVEPARRITPRVRYDCDTYEAAVAAGDLWADRASGESPRESDTDSIRPIRTDDGSLLARPAPEQVTPVGLRWHGVGTHRRDWMCRLTPAPAIADEHSEHGQPPLAALIDQLGQADIPLAFQVVFTARRSWAGDREHRIADLERGEDTRLGRVGGLVTEMVSGQASERRDREQLPRRARRRLDEMDRSDPETSFTATVRALTLCVDPERVRGWPTDQTFTLESDSTAPSLPSGLTQLRGLLGPLSGEFYELQATRFREKGFRQQTAETDARRAFERFRTREVCASESGRSRPHLVVAPDELAGLVAVPSASALSVPATRDTRALDQVETPLPRPDPDRLEHFREGMAIGHALDEHHKPEHTPIRIPPAALTRHYARYGPTGSGKSIAIQNDILSLHDSTTGPTVLLDRKGDGMVEDYLQAHYTRFGDLDDVYCLSLPEVLPAVPFFDVRPGLAAGRDRATVIQEKVEHFREILRLVMGEDLFNQAFVANEIIAFLIRALFDPHYQHDAFGLDDLTDAAMMMQAEKQLPATSTALQDTADSLARQLEKNDAQFQRSMDAVLNRLDVLRENTHLARVLRTVPEWNAETETYESGTFDFRRLIDQDVVVLIDMGDLRAESSRALTLVLLSNLWDALQYQRGGRGTPPSDEVINLIIEEAAPLVASSLVHEDLLPQGRSFGLGLGLVMQFPEQVLSATEARSVGRRAYQELLNNVHTQIVGGITLTDEFGASLVTEGLDVASLRERCNQLPAGEWIVDLPQTPFLELPPQPLSVRSLPIPEGHPESDAPLSDTEQQSFRAAREQMKARSETALGIQSGNRTTQNPPRDSRRTLDPSGEGSESTEMLRSESPKTLPLFEDSEQEGEDS